MNAKAKNILKIVLDMFLFLISYVVPEKSPCRFVLLAYSPSDLTNFKNEDSDFPLGRTPQYGYEFFPPLFLKSNWLSN